MSNCRNGVVWGSQGHSRSLLAFHTLCPYGGDFGWLGVTRGVEVIKNSAIRYRAL